MPPESRGILRNRNFLLLWAAYGVSAMGDHLSEMALLNTQKALSQEVGVTQLYARMTFLFFLPFFLFGPVMGLLADRFPRRGLMVLADLVRFGIMLAFPLLLTWTGEWGSWGAFSPLFLVGAFAALFSPARSSLLPTLMPAEDLVRANAMISGLGIVCTMIATQVGGYLADTQHPNVAFRLDAFTFLTSALLLLLMRPPRHEAIPSGNVWADLQDGFRYSLGHKRVVQLILLGTVVWGCGVIVRSSIPAIVRDVYHGTFFDMSTYQLYLAIGFIIGSALLLVLGNALRSEMAITWSLVGLALAILGLAMSVLLPLSPIWAGRWGAVAIVLAGVFGVAVMTSVNALLQRVASNRYRGRVMGVNDLCTNGGVLFSTSLLGIPNWARLDAWVGYLLVGVALFVLSVGFASLLIRLRSEPMRRAQAFWFHVNEFWSKLWYRFERLGRSTVPRKGAVIVTANHISPADPLFLSAGCPYRPLSFMIAQEYADIPVARLFVRLVDCIPVKRDGQDSAATKAALRHLQNNGALGIFLEGGIPAPGEQRELKDGVALLALRTGAAVIPVHISGAIHKEGVFAGLFARHRARVRFGKPVDLSSFADYRGDREKLQAATRKIYEAIQALAPN